MQTRKEDPAMTTAVLTLRLYAPWVHSLKEKRMEVKSLLAKIRNKFNVAAIEAEEQDVHQIIVLAVAALAANPSQADSILDHVLDYVEEHSEAEIVTVLRDHY